MSNEEYEIKALTYYSYALATTGIGLASIFYSVITENNYLVGNIALGTSILAGIFYGLGRSNERRIKE